MMKPRNASHEDMFFPRLEALRGLAALIVACYHCGLAPWVDALREQNPVRLGAPHEGPVWQAITWFVNQALNGHAAVLLFFVISGFVLTLSLARHDGAPRPASRRFVVGRIFRIYPAAIATVVIFVVIFWLTGLHISEPQYYGPIWIVANLLLIDTTINGVMWSLRLELIAVPLILACYFAWRRWGDGALIVALVVLCALSFTKDFHQPFGFLLMLGRLQAFVVGMLVVVYGRALVDACSERMVSLAFLASALVFFGAAPAIGWYSNWTPMVQSLSGGVMVAFVAYGRFGGIGRIFDWRPVRFLGKVSYSFYLLHPLTMLIMWGYTAPQTAMIGLGIPSVVVILILSAVTVTLVLPLAALMYRYIERPGIAAGRAFLARHQAASDDMRYQSAKP